MQKYTKQTSKKNDNVFKKLFKININTYNK